MPGRPARKERQSQISRHPERHLIELARAGGVSLDKIATRFGVHRDAVARHWHSLSDEYRAGLIVDVPREELMKRALEESGLLLDHMKLARNIAEQQLFAAKACGDSHAVANLTRAVLDANNAVGKLTGEISRLAPTFATTINNTTNVIALMESPAFRDLETGLLDICQRHPAVKGEIVDLVKRLHDRPEPVTIEGERAVA